jgi:hypothetical protein
VVQGRQLAAARWAGSEGRRAELYVWPLRDLLPPLPPCPRCSARAHNAAAAYFLARAHSADGLESAGGSGPLKPLLREGPAKEGVEHASSHVPGPQAIVHVLQYQPLSGSEQ